MAFTVAFEGERFERTLVSVLDISAQKNAERALREQAQQLLRSAQSEVEQRRLTEQAAQRLAAIVESSDDAILAKISTASSPVGTGVPSACSATCPTR